VWGFVFAEEEGGLYGFEEPVKLTPRLISAERLKKAPAEPFSKSVF